MQFITDEKGRHKAVVVPIKECEELQRIKNKLETLSGIDNALDEIQQIREGKRVKGRSLIEFLNEVNFKY